MSDRNGENNNVSWDSCLVAVRTYDRNSSASGVNRTYGKTGVVDGQFPRVQKQVCKICGVMYTGEMADGKAHGIVTYADGSVYTGMLEEGNKPGDFGTVTYGGGKTYIGELKDCKPYGFGIMTYHDKSAHVYVGQWKAGERCGRDKSTEVMMQMMTSDRKHTVSYAESEWSTNNFSSGRPATADNEERVARVITVRQATLETVPETETETETETEAEVELRVKFNTYQKFTLTLPPKGIKLGLTLRANKTTHTHILGNMTEIVDVDENSPLMNLIPKDVCIVSLKAGAIGFVQPRSMKDTVESFGKVQAAASKQLEMIVAPNDTTSGGKSAADVKKTDAVLAPKVAFAFGKTANEYFPIPARDSAKKPPADANKKDESNPPETRTSTSSAKKSTPLRRSARRSARRSEV